MKTTSLYSRLTVILLFCGFCGAASGQASVTTFKARRARAMQAAPDSLLLVRSLSLVGAENKDSIRQDATFYYLTGLENAAGAVLVMDAPRRESWLFVPAPGQLPGFGRLMHPPYGYVEPASAQRLGLEHVDTWDQFESFLNRRLAENPELVLRGSFRKEWQENRPAVLAGVDQAGLWESALRARWPNAHFAPAPDSDALREIKDADEVLALRRVAESSSAALRAGLAALRPGRRQREAEIDVVNACVRSGGNGVSFWPWIMTGSNSDIAVAIQSLGDYHFLDRRMRAGDLARVDVGCSRENYSGDVGRTAPVSGRFDAGQREAWDMFVSAYRAALAVIKPGLTSRDVFAAWQAEFKRRQPQLKTSFARRTAEVALSTEGSKFWQMHGVGIEAAEGYINGISEGQVLAFEPILTVDGVGIYLEDMILVTSNGAEVLTKGLPYTSSEIEAAMRTGRVANR